MSNRVKIHYYLYSIFIIICFFLFLICSEIIDIENETTNESRQRLQKDKVIDLTDENDVTTEMSIQPCILPRNSRNDNLCDTVSLSTPQALIPIITNDRFPGK